MERNQSFGPKAEPSTEGPVLLRAVNTTLRALEDRGRYFRNLIVAVVMMAAAYVLFAIMIHQWTPLLGFILLIPLVGGYLILDSRRVRRWRSEVLQTWRAEAKDYPMFQKTMAGFRHLPARSLVSMLATLPEAVDGPAIGQERKKADDFEASYRRNERQMLSMTFLLTTTLSALAGAALYRSSALLICGLSLVAVVAILKTRWTHPLKESL